MPETAIAALLIWNAAQFTWDRYAGRSAELQDMSREEVVSMLKRRSTGFSRCDALHRVVAPACWGNTLGGILGNKHAI